MKNLIRKRKENKKNNWTTDITQRLSSCLIAKIVSTNIKGQSSCKCKKKQHNIERKFSKADELFLLRNLTQQNHLILDFPIFDLVLSEAMLCKYH